jgi:hypothetical protein
MKKGRKGKTHFLVRSLEDVRFFGRVRLGKVRERRGEGTVGRGGRVVAKPPRSAIRRLTEAERGVLDSRRKLKPEPGSKTEAEIRAEKLNNIR